MIYENLKTIENKRQDFPELTDLTPWDELHFKSNQNLKHTISSYQNNERAVDQPSNLKKFDSLNSSQNSDIDFDNQLLKIASSTSR